MFNEAEFELNYHSYMENCNIMVYLAEGGNFQFF